MIEPVAWMVTNVDGQDAYVTTNPALAQAGQIALPLYTLDRKDVLILELYREQHGEALGAIRQKTTPCGECHLQPGERCDICGALAETP